VVLNNSQVNDINAFTMNIKDAKEPAKLAAKAIDTEGEDRGENINLMEPMLIGEGSRFRSRMTDLALELAQRSSAFRGSLPQSLRASLADLVRAMNCYYSNLIEGHNTHPIDIERAQKSDYSQNAHKRNLQIEAKAHISVQKWIDEGGLKSRATSIDGIREIHRRFCEELPDELLWVENNDTKELVRVIPGELRTLNVRVGDHNAISPGAVPRFLNRFSEVYSPLSKTDTILASAAAHHRLTWIHPFLDGNGRVARLMSHAMFLDTLDTGAVWSVARGLARSEVGNYKERLASCDATRRNDLDGRGHLSEEALMAFTDYFLNVCIDQVDFMEKLMQPQELRTRIVSWAEEEIKLRNLPPGSGRVLEAVLYRGGEMARSEAIMNGTSERSTQRIVAALIEKSVLASTSSRAPLRLAFPAALAHRWMPGLYPAGA
jgi:Fic family protein